MITHEQIKLLVAAAEIVDAIRGQLRAIAQLNIRDPVGKLADVATDLHLVIGQLQDLCTCDDCIKGKDNVGD
jgi:hypothetical protein